MNWALIVSGNLIELFIIYKYWFSLLEPRYSRTRSTVLYTVINLLSVIRSWFMFEHVTLKAVLTTVISLALMQLLFKDPWYKKVIVHTIYMICVMFAEYFAFIFAKYVYHYDMNGLIEPTLPCFMWQATAYLFVFIFNIIALLLLKNKKINPDDKVTQFVFLYLALQCLTVFVFTMMVFEYNVTSFIMVAIIAFVLVGSFFIGICIYVSVKYATVRSIEAEYIKKESEIKDRHFNELKKQYGEYRRLRHDFLNHLRIMNELKDPEKLTEYTGRIKAKFDEMEHISYCDNLTLDALLVLKKTDAIEKDINVNYEICDIDGCEIHDFDLCTIISNLLDNAVEAAALTEDKYVTLQIIRKSGRLLVVVKNSSNEVNMSLKTTKEDKENHGMGINCIRAVAERYDGDCVFRYENGEFTAVVNMNY